MKRDRLQFRIGERLSRLVGPGAAAFFRDACRLMTNPASFESTSHLVAHLIREIESSIRDVLRNVAPTVPSRTEKNHEAAIRLILAALAIPPDDPVAVAWLEHVPGKEGLNTRAHRKILAAPRGVDEAFVDFWEGIQAVLDVVLERFEKRFLEVHKHMDLLAEKDAPTAEDISFLKKSVPDAPVARGVFFDRLNGPAWIMPLANEGFFSDPPPAERDEAAGTISFQPWPPGRYLARMAAIPEAQKSVLDVALSVPATDNIHVHENLADIAVALPPALSKQLAPKARDWLSHPHQGQLGARLGGVVVSLVQAGETLAALDLANDLLAVVPAPRRTGRPGADDTLYRKPRGHFDDWHYERALATCLPALQSSAGTETLDMLCGLLDRAVEFSQWPSGVQGKDHSWSWRSAIEDHSQNHSGSIRDMLVTAVRDSAREIASRDSAATPVLIGRLESRAGSIYRRIALDLLSEEPKGNRALVEARLLDRSNLCDVSLRHEYARLTSAAFACLTEEKQSTLLSLIDVGPDLESHVARQNSAELPQLTDGEVRRRRRSWQCDRLAPFKDDLPEEWRARYDAMVAELGEPQHPDFPSYLTSYVGAASPVNKTEILAMGATDLLKHLRGWVPSREWGGPTLEGMGRELSAAVGSDADRFSKAAATFKGLDATYVRAVFDGIQKGMGVGQSVEWNPVLDLAAWTLAQPRAVDDPDGDEMGRDPSWEWARSSIAGLLERGLDSIPFQSRGAVWGIIDGLLKDPDPTPEHEERYGGSNMDPATMSINTVRGKAIHALVLYALWVRRNIDASDATKDFGAMPEVRTALDEHLDPSKDPSTTARSVYGQRLSDLISLDRDWVERHLADIFPIDPTQASLREAAWGAFLAFNNAGAGGWPLLNREYERAVENLAIAPPTGDAAPDSPERHVVEHIMVFYWLGSIGLEKGSLVYRFFEGAPETFRQHAIDFLGRLASSKKMSRQVAERLRVLWEERLARGGADLDHHRGELAAFGWWSKVAHFDLDWRLHQVQMVLKSVGRIDSGFIVTEMLAEAVKTRPAAAIRCLMAMVGSEPDNSGSAMWSSEVREILSAAMASGDDQAERGARDVINVLAAQGHQGYSNLLSERPILPGE